MFRTIALFFLLFAVIKIEAFENFQTPYHVNPLTGSYQIVEQDFMVQGPLPFVLERTWSNEEKDGYDFYQWKIKARPLGAQQHDLKIHHLVDDNDFLERVEVINRSEASSFGHIEFDYNTSPNTVSLLSHQMQGLSYSHIQGKLDQVFSNGKTISYEYIEHPINKSYLISKRDEGDHRYLINEYYTYGSNEVGDQIVTIDERNDFRIGRVRLQKAPVGYDENPVIVAKFLYFEDRTEVFDALNHLKVYRIGKTRDQIEAIEDYLEGQSTPYRTTSYYWGQVNGKPQLMGIANLDQTGTVLDCKTYAYHPTGALAEKTQWGNLSGKSEAAIVVDANGVPQGTDVEKYTQYYSYDASGLLLQKAEDNGKSISYLYSESGPLLGKLLKCNGTVYARAGYEYNEEGLLSSYFEDECPYENIAHYDGLSDRRVTQFVHSNEPCNKGLPILIEESLFDTDKTELVPLSKTTLRYTEKGELIQKQAFDSRSDCQHESLAWYDYLGRVSLAKDNHGQEAAFYYDSHGNAILSIDAATGNEVSITYDFANRPIQTVKRDLNGEVQKISTTYNSLNQQIKTEDRHGNETHYCYDALGRLNKVIFPSVLDISDARVNPVVHYQYDEHDNMTCVIDPKGYRTQISYNSSKKPIQIIYPDHTQDSFEYFPDGKLYAYLSKNGIRTVYEYDQAGRPIGEIPVEVSIPQIKIDHHQEIVNDGHHEELVYEKNRHQELLKKSFINPNGTITETIFDALGHPECITLFDCFGNEVGKQELRYDLAGNKVVQKDYIYQSGSISGVKMILWEYGPGNRIQRVIEGWGSDYEKSIHYTYNQIGQLIELLKSDGVSLCWSYDPLGKIERFYSSDQSFAYQYYYDDVDNIIGVDDIIKGTSGIRHFNEEHKLTEELLSNGLHLLREYDEQGHLAKLQLPDGSSIYYTYKDGKLDAIERKAANGANQYSHTYLDYDQEGRPLKVKMIGNLGEISFEWDSEGHCRSIKSPYWEEIVGSEDDTIHTINVKDVAGEHVSKYRYDELNQLIEEIGIATCEYTYDSLLNRLSKAGEQYTVNSLNQTLTAGKTSFYYDANGNLTLKKSPESSTHYVYDALNRLTEVSQEGKFVANYTYDAFHRRLSRSACIWNQKSKQWERLSFVNYIYDGNQEIGSVDAYGKIVELRVLGQGIGAELGASVAIEIQNNVYAPIHDHRGSIACLVNMHTGKAEEYYHYSAFGEELIVSGQGQQLQTTAVGNPWRFSSKRKDPLTGLINYGRRDYLPEIGKWMTQDPFGSVESPNRYAFLLNNPLSYVDLYGLFSIRAIWQNMEETLLKWYQAISEAFNPLFSHAYEKIGELGEFLMGKNLLLISGYYYEPSETGIFGHKELDPKLRITFINGLFNLKSHFMNLVRIISQSHGNNVVHYIYKGISGWGRDMYSALFIKLGMISNDAHQLAALWKNLIEEMGGVEDGGLIIHYAHSLGGTETSRARNLLKPEEQKMIRVITFGSPTMVADEGFQGVLNFISCRDGVSQVCDPAGYLKALMGFDCNIVMLGSFKGAPLIDHSFVMYWDYWMDYIDPEWTPFIPDAA